MPALGRPASCLITRGLATDADAASLDEILESIRRGVESGVSMIQVREKLLSGRALFDLVRAAAEICRESVSKLLINDRADIAAAAGADGVHLRSDSLPTAIVRQAFTDLIIGRSVHDVHEAEMAAKDADFVLFGPVFSSPGKEPAGLENLKFVCQRLGDFPVLAVGGITSANAAEVLKTGAAGIAAIREMNEADSLRAIMEALGR